MFEDIPDKGCLSRVDNNNAFMNVGKISYEISMQGNLISQVFWIFLVVTEEDRGVLFQNFWEG